ncbi:MAG: hypothetical protein ACRCT8_13070 [Lacipirellulaceae bacterium]
MKTCNWFLCAMVALAAPLASAGVVSAVGPIFRITETYVGISGPDGTPDWIEVTNFGDTDGDTGILFYDDENPSVASGVALPSFILSPFETAVFMVTADVDVDSISRFTNVWGAVANLGAADGGGGLGQGGDQANLLLANGTVVDSLTYTSTDGLRTWEDPTGLGPIALSTLGQRGAYESNPFLNETIGFPPGPGATVTLVGSPGVIPEPTAALLAVLAAAGVAGARSRS